MITFVAVLLKLTSKSCHLCGSISAHSLHGSTINNHCQYSLLKKQCLKIIIWQSGFFSDQNSDQNSNLNSWRILLPSASPTGFFANSRSNIEASLYCKLFATFLQCKHCRKPHFRNGVVDTFGLILTEPSHSMIKKNLRFSRSISFWAITSCKLLRCCFLTDVGQFFKTSDILKIT